MAIRYVNLPPKEVFDRISDGITGRYFTAEKLNSHVADTKGAGETVVGVFEKYSWRNSNRMTMTVVCTAVGREGKRTEVYYVASGAASGIFGLFDWGASEAFESAVERVLSELPQSTSAE